MLRASTIHSVKSDQQVDIWNNSICMYAIGRLRHRNWVWEPYNPPLKYERVVDIISIHSVYNRRLHEQMLSSTLVCGVLTSMLEFFFTFAPCDALLPAVGVISAKRVVQMITRILCVYWVLIHNLTRDMLHISCAVIYICCFSYFASPAFSYNFSLVCKSPYRCFVVAFRDMFPAC
jgi:hypothetical protein